MPQTFTYEFFREIETQPLSPKQKDQFAYRVLPVLEEIARDSGSDYVLLSVVVDGSLAVKVPFPSEDAAAVPDHLDLPLPDIEENRNSWGRRAFPHGYTNENTTEELTAKQQEFNKKIREKAWCKVFFRDGTAVVEGVVCLLRSHETSYAPEDVLRAWFKMQHFFSAELSAEANQQSSLHCGFLDSIQRLSDYWDAGSVYDYWRRVASALVSDPGLDWDFAYIAEVQEHELRCIDFRMCDDHSQDLEDTLSGLTKLVDEEGIELREPLLEQPLAQDPLFFQANECTIVPIAMPLFPQDHHVRCMVNRIIDPGQIWQQSLDAIGRLPDEIPADMFVFALPILVCGKKIVVFIGAQEQETRSGSGLLTSLFCEWAASSCQQWIHATSEQHRLTPDETRRLHRLLSERYSEAQSQ